MGEALGSDQGDLRVLLPVPTAERRRELILRKLIPAWKEGLVSDDELDWFLLTGTASWVGR